MNVLSLFDGISCCHLALDKAGIQVDKYYSSEIDKYAIQVTQSNYQDTIQLGDVRNVYGKDLPKIDLIAFGSPCQGFSFAGKQLNFKDERSALFFEAVRLLKEIKPKYFLMENVIMKEEYKNAISDILGDIYPECVKQLGLFSSGRLDPIQINSALVSAQNRERLYWTNIPVKGMPADKGIMLKDIIDGDAGIKIIVGSGDVVCGAMRGRYLVDGKRADDTVESMAGLTQQRIEIRDDGKTNTLTTVQKDNLCIMVGEADLNGHDYVKRVYSEEGKAPSLCTGSGGNHEPKVALKNMQWRKLSVAECCKLQTIDPQYIANGKISNSQAYKCLGNGWTKDIPAWIFSFIT